MSNTPSRLVRRILSVPALGLVATLALTGFAPVASPGGAVQAPTLPPGHGAVAVLDITMHPDETFDVVQIMAFSGPFVTLMGMTADDLVDDMRWEADRAPTPTSVDPFTQADYFGVIMTSQGISPDDLDWWINDELAFLLVGDTITVVGEMDMYLGDDDLFPEEFAAIMQMFVQVNVTLPGAITETNGTVTAQSANTATVTWIPQMGELNPMSATASLVAAPEAGLPIEDLPGMADIGQDTPANQPTPSGEPPTELHPDFDPNDYRWCLADDDLEGLLDLAAGLAECDPFTGELVPHAPIPPPPHPDYDPNEEFWCFPAEERPYVLTHLFYCDPVNGISQIDWSGSDDQPDAAWPTSDDDSAEPLHPFLDRNSSLYNPYWCLTDADHDAWALMIEEGMTVSWGCDDQEVWEFWPLVNGVPTFAGEASPSVGATNCPPQVPFLWIGLSALGGAGLVTAAALFANARNRKTSPEGATNV
ncbi:MAG: hypothetical protein FWD83_03865 [Promicromonosporaceae bacterium]|nr:hypothetical protein [Promicromonosporaceae bacterium]